MPCVCMTASPQPNTTSQSYHVQRYGELDICFFKQDATSAVTGVEFYPGQLEFLLVAYRASKRQEDFGFAWCADHEG